MRSGDPDNREAIAAQYYFKTLLGKGFVRERGGGWPNSAFNYCYAIVRAMVAKALSGSGLLPTLGIHHHNRYNAYALADDIMEPYRPYADRQVLLLLEQLGEEVPEELSKEQRGHLLKVLTTDCRMGKKTRPLQLAVQETSASLAQAFSGGAAHLLYPRIYG